jgi:hypothetical protein
MLMLVLMSCRRCLSMQQRRSWWSTQLSGEQHILSPKLGTFVL